MLAIAGTPTPVEGEHSTLPMIPTKVLFGLLFFVHPGSGFSDECRDKVFHRLRTTVSSLDHCDIMREQMTVPLGLLTSTHDCLITNVDLKMKKKIWRLKEGSFEVTLGIPQKNKNVTFQNPFPLEMRCEPQAVFVSVNVSVSSEDILKLGKTLVPRRCAEWTVTNTTLEFEEWCERKIVKESKATTTNTPAPVNNTTPATSSPETYPMILGASGNRSF